MCKFGRGWLISLSVAASALASVEARAQDVRELTRRLDAVVALRDEATKAFIADQVARAKSRVYPDTVRIAGGAISIATTHEFLPLVREASAAADSLIRARLGSLVSAMRPTRLAVGQDTVTREKPLLTMRNITDGREDEGVLFPPVAAELTNLIRGRALQQLFVTRPTLARWLPIVLPADTAADAEWRAMRLDLSVSPTSVAHRCYDGDVIACKLVLGLAVEPDPVMAWYDSVGRLAIIESVAGWGQLPRVQVAQCKRGSDAACIALLRTNQVLLRFLEPPSTPLARAGLVQQAMIDGGAGSLGRFLERDRPVPEAISTAANLPIDTVVAHWQRHVHDGAIRSDAFTPGIALLSVGWIVAMGGLATRSSRWR